MKGNLITNTVGLGLVEIFYYFSVMTIQYIFGLFDTIPVLNTWSTYWTGPAWLIWELFLYFVFPICIAAVYIVKTRPGTRYLPY